MQSLQPHPVRSEIVRTASLLALAGFLVVVALPALLELAAAAAP